MEKKNQPAVNKISSIIPVLITILVCMLMFLPLGVFVGANYFGDSETEETENTEKQEANQEEEIELTSDIAKVVIDTYNTIYLSEEKVYISDLYDVESLTNYDLVATAFGLTDKSGISYCGQGTARDFTLDYFNNLLKDYYENKTIDMNIINSLSSTTTINDFQVKVNGNYLKLYGSCGGGVFNAADYTNTNIEKITQKDDYVYIYEKAAFAKYVTISESEEQKVNYYKDYSRTGEVLETLNSSQFTNSDGSKLENSEPNWLLYNTYKYTFKKHDNGYYFEKVELVK